MGALSLFFLLSTLNFNQILAVEECYVCLEKCDFPLRIQKCRHENLSEDIKMKCYSIGITTERGKFTEKGCLPADVADVQCRKVNDDERIECTVCEGNLCNKSNVFFVNFILFVFVIGALYYI